MEFVQPPMAVFVLMSLQPFQALAHSLQGAVVTTERPVMRQCTASDRQMALIIDRATEGATVGAAACATGIIVGKSAILDRCHRVNTTAWNTSQNGNGTARCAVTR